MHDISAAAATMPYSMLTSSSATTPKLRATMWRPSAGCAATVKQSVRANVGSGHNGAVDVLATLHKAICAFALVAGTQRTGFMEVKTRRTFLRRILMPTDRLSPDKARYGRRDAVRCVGA